MLAGWTTTETGRQPWTVYGLMRTAHSVTPSLTGIDVLISLLGYVVGLSDHLSCRPLVHDAHRAAAAPTADRRAGRAADAPPRR